MRYRSPARWLAPVALVVCAIAAIAVVQGGTSSGDGDKDDAAVTTKTAKAKSGSGAKKTATAKRKRTYTVQSGDVLSAIAEQHDTTVEELQQLNPSLDAGTLRVGQKIRLPR